MLVDEEAAAASTIGASRRTITLGEFTRSENSLEDSYVGMAVNEELEEEEEELEDELEELEEEEEEEELEDELEDELDDDELDDEGGVYGFHAHIARVYREHF